MAQRLELHHGWVGDQASHDTQLHRVRRARGKAKEHLCVRCLQRRADDWAHVHGESGLDVYADFVSLCHPCHKRYDNATEMRGPMRSLASGSLSETQVQRIRKLLAQKVSNRKISEEISCGVTIVSKIRNGHIYVGVGE